MQSNDYFPMLYPYILKKSFMVTHFFLIFLEERKKESKERVERKKEKKERKKRKKEKKEREERKKEKKERDLKN